MATRIGTGTKSQRIEPLTKRKAWKARQTHYKQVRELGNCISAVPGFIGFAVGRPDFWDPLVNWRAKKIT